MSSFELESEAECCQSVASEHSSCSISSSDSSLSSSSLDSSNCSSTNSILSIPDEEEDALRMITGMIRDDDEDDDDLDYGELCKQIILASSRVIPQSSMLEWLLRSIIYLRQEKEHEDENERISIHKRQRAEILLDLLPSCMNGQDEHEHDDVDRIHVQGKEQELRSILDTFQETCLSSEKNNDNHMDDDSGNKIHCEKSEGDDENGNEKRRVRTIAIKRVHISWMLRILQMMKLTKISEPGPMPLLVVKFLTWCLDICSKATTTIHVENNQDVDVDVDVDVDAEEEHIFIMDTETDTNTDTDSEFDSDSDDSDNNNNRIGEIHIKLQAQVQQVKIQIFDLMLYHLSQIRVEEQGQGQDGNKEEKIEVVKEGIHSLRSHFRENYMGKRNGADADEDTSIDSNEDDDHDDKDSLVETMAHSIIHHLQIEHERSKDVQGAISIDKRSDHASISKGNKNASAKGKKTKNASLDQKQKNVTTNSNENIHLPSNMLLEVYRSILPTLEYHDHTTMDVFALLAILYIDAKNNDSDDNDNDNDSDNGHSSSRGIRDRNCNSYSSTCSILDGYSNKNEKGIPPLTAILETMQGLVLFKRGNNCKYLPSISHTYEHVLSYSNVVEEILLPAMIRLGVYLLLSPLRHPHYPPPHYYSNGNVNANAKAGVNVKSADSRDEYATSPSSTPSQDVFEHHPIQRIMIQTQDFMLGVYSILPAVSLREEVMTLLLSLSDMDYLLRSEINIRPEVVGENEDSSGSGKTRANKARSRQYKSMNTRSSVERNTMLDSLPYDLKVLLMKQSKTKKLKRRHGGGNSCDDVCDDNDIDDILLDERYWYDVFMSSMTVLISIIQANGKNKDDNNKNGNDHIFEDSMPLGGMQIIVQRIERFAQSSWYDETNETATRMKRGASILTNSKDYECVLIGLYCRALVEYMKYSSCCRTSKDCALITTSDTMDMLERFLGTFWNDHYASNGMVTNNGSVVVGLILARYIIQLSTMSKPDQELIVEWVTDILTTSCGTSNADYYGTHCAVPLDPVTGYWGLQFLFSLCTAFDSTTSYLLGSVFKDGSPTPLLKPHIHRERFHFISIDDVFRQVKEIMTALKVMVAAPDFESNDTDGERKEASSSARANYSIGYKRIPQYYNNGKSAKRIMFCTSFILEKLNIDDIMTTSHGKGMVEWMQFVQLLMHIYLEIGSKTSTKWSPDTILLACIELASMDDECEIELSIGNVFLDTFDGIHNSSLSESGWSSDDDSKLHSSSKDIARCIWSSALSMAIYNATIQNAYHFYSSQTTLSNKKRKTLWQLIKFQVAKLYDLQTRFYSTTKLLHICSETCLHDDTSTGDEDAPISFPVARSLISDIFIKGICIPHSLILDIKLDWENDLKVHRWGNLMRALTNIKDGKMLNSHSWQQPLVCLGFALNLHCFVSYHMRATANERLAWIETKVKGKSAKSNYMESSKNIFLASFLEDTAIARIFQSSRTMILWLEPLKRCVESLAGESKLPVSRMLQSVYDRTQKSLTSTIDVVRKALQCHRNHDMVKSKSVAMDTLLGSFKDGKERKSLIHSSLCGLIQEVLVCGDSIISLNILQLLFFVSGIEVALQELVHKTNWHQLSLQGVANISVILPPASFLCTLREYIANTSADISTIALSQAVIINLLRLSTKTSSDYKSNSLLRFKLLAHWSYAVYHSVSSFDEECNTVIDAFKSTLEEERNNNTYIFPKKARSKKKIGCSIVIPDLHRDSYHIYFELTLALIVATLMLKSTASMNLKKCDDSGNDGCFKSFSKSLIGYSNAIREFGSSFELFPTSIILSTLRTSSLMIKACESILKNVALTEIMISPHASPRKKRTAKTTSLALTENMKDHCIQCIEESLLNRFESNHASTREQKRLVACLQSDCSRLSSLIKTCMGKYNILPSMLETIGTLPSRSRVKNEESSNTKTNKKGEIVTEHNATIASIRDSEELKLEPNLSNIFVGKNASNRETIEIGHDENNHSSEEDDDSFGVMGEW